MIENVITFKTAPPAQSVFRVIKMSSSEQEDRIRYRITYHMHTWGKIWSGWGNMLNLTDRVVCLWG